MIQQAINKTIGSLTALQLFKRAEQSKKRVAELRQMRLAQQENMARIKKMKRQVADIKKNFSTKMNTPVSIGGVSIGRYKDISPELKSKLMEGK